MHSALTTPVPPSPLQASWLSPLNLAAYITWVAVLLQSVAGARLRDGDAREWLGCLLLLGMMAAYLATAHGKVPVTRHRALVLVQAACVIAACAVLREGGTNVLLIVVAAQVVALWDRRDAVLLLIGINLVVIGIWSTHFGWMQVLLYLLPMIGFQAFAALTVHYATSAERAHEALALTHAELLATQRLLEDSARTGERLRLSRELHDVAGHKLTALRLNLRLLARDTVFAARDELRICETLADELLSDIRAVVSELRRHDGIDLPAAIAKLVQAIPGVRFDVDIDAALRVMRVETAEILLRCAQEGITNALRHGRASHIVLRCEQRDARIVLTIRNDGAPLRDPVFGNGLTGMRERLRDAGGDLSLTALAGGGAQLRASLPGDL